MASLPLPAQLTLGVFVLWAIAEGAVQAVGVRQPDAPDRRPAALATLLIALFGSLLLGWADAAVFGWTTLGAAWEPLRWVGAGLVAAGCALRLVARWTLGRGFSGYVQTTGGHRLVTRGVYAWVRHPVYLATVLLYVGLPLGFGSLGALVIGLGVGLPALWRRVRLEEAALGEWFGEEWAAYAERTARLAPGVW